MPRVLGIDIPGRKRVEFALRYIYGVGPARARELIEKANTFQAQGRGVAAAPLYQEAADLFAPYASFKLVAADMLMRYEQWADAAAAYQGVLDAHPDHDQARAGLKLATAKLGKKTKKGWFGRG